MASGKRGPEESYLAYRQRIKDVAINEKRHLDGKYLWHSGYYDNTGHWVRTGGTMRKNTN